MTTYRKHISEASPLTELRPEDARRLRAKAWRHLRRINGARARRLWLRVRGRDHWRQAA